MKTEKKTFNQKAIASFIQNHPGFDFQHFNFVDPDAVKQLHLPEGEKGQQLLVQLQTLQRLVRLMPAQEPAQALAAAEALYQAGIHSVYQITALSQHQFIEDYATILPQIPGVTPEQLAQNIYQAALSRRNQLVLHYTAISQHNSPHYRATQADNYSTKTAKNFDNLPSYQELFGNLDFCTCEDCRTVFSPAAYFVDLMRLQSTYIRPSKSDEPAHRLQDRRPDLGALELSCDNTNQLVSKLSIVNQVLLGTLYGTHSMEKVYKSLISKGFLDQDGNVTKVPTQAEIAPLVTGELLPGVGGTSATVEHLSQQIIQILGPTGSTVTQQHFLASMRAFLVSLSRAQQYHVLDEQVYPLNLPFHLPLTQIRQYLSQQKTSLPELWGQLMPQVAPAGQAQKTQLDHTKHSIDKERLQLSKKQWDIDCTELDGSTPESVTTLASYYGFPDVTDASVLIRNLEDATAFCQQTGLDPAQLQLLLFADLSQTELDQHVNAGFFVNAVKEGETTPPLSLTTNPETGNLVFTKDTLTVLRLDHMNRLIRLSQALNFSAVV